MSNDDSAHGDVGDRAISRTPGAAQAGRPISKLAIFGLAASIVGAGAIALSIHVPVAFLTIIAIAGLILSIAALPATRSHRLRGRWAAVTGIVVGGLGTLALVGYVIFILSQFATNPP